MTPPRIRQLFGVLMFTLLALPAHAADALTTLAERSGFQTTGRIEEVEELCRVFESAHPKQLRCQEFGRSPEGRPLLMLSASATAVSSPAQARAAGLPVVLVQGGIHAGEIDGKDAGFLLLRQLLDGQAGSDVLDRLVLLFVPVFNVDGLARFGRWNRPNQRGPEQTGWRTTARNYNLNRDYAKADTVEMRAMLALVEAWDPLLIIDLHATDGAQFEHDVSVQVEPLHAGDGELKVIGRHLRDAVMAELRQAGSLPLPFYPSFVIGDDPSSGFVDGVAQPRFSTGYFPLRNRLAMLVETHSWRTYPERVKTTRNTVLAALQQVAKHGQPWQDAAEAADERAADLAGAAMALDYEATETSRLIDFRGYAYTREPSEVSGALMTRYDERRPQIWRIPLRDEVRPKLEVKAPGGGYLVPAAYAPALAERLSAHGIHFRPVDQARPALPVQTFRASVARFADTSYEGRQRLTVEGQWQDETRELPAGSLFVPIRQAKSRLLMALLEPLAPDSLLAWGEFNLAFVRQEYMEPYVAEQIARDMLANDPAVKAAFEQRLQADPAFAASAEQRLDFFYRRHSAWDERVNLYPVLRVDREP